ncbi:beta-lactamase class C [Paraburkholderia bannensis]|uniref:Beta-lactamase class C n=1 Tax=Paraburkholderia bannensis TaxID=765414 RepID=A0A7W9TXY9_9BURK|nr:MULTISPECIES: class C beta-lactamase [Paraburkholderia]MBB3258460.1 beta-lactamase class C [Paraburkholderia sp. WP4_3_2]MBB6103473.1 beta-lactamase class C [Paraburkholderia bannensis]
MNIKTKAVLMASTLALSYAAVSAHAAQPAMKAAVDAAIGPVQAQYGIPGVAVGISVDGKHAFYNYGVASKATGARVDGDTLFEVGSVTKTVTATLACYAQTQGKLSFAAPVTHYVSALRGSVFDHVSVLNLGTHTSGLPLFVPDAVTNDAQLTAWLRNWQPASAPGTQRVYSNMGIGLLGRAAAQSLGKPEREAVEQDMLPAFGMAHTWLRVPPASEAHYAQGYDKTNTPKRMNPGVFDDEAYGVRTTSADLVRYIDANMGIVPLDAAWQRAIDCTHTGYYTAGPFTQDVVWEQYPWPVALDTLERGNGPDAILKPTPARALTPPLAPQADALINKTGSTNGFSAYIAYVPARRIGVVILANKAYPNEARVRAAYAILEALDKANARR